MSSKAPLSVPQVAPKAPAQAPAPEPVVAQPAPVLAREDRVPSNWNIVPGSVDEHVVATNNVTGTVFSGTAKEFSAFIKG